MKLSMLKEANGQVSTMRVLTIFVVVSVVGTWSVLSIMRGEFVDLPVEQIALVLGALGLKGWQRGREE